MKRCRITPYEGNQPYIFISYAHKDSKIVYPILEELERRGYRIWYDDGIAPGSEWPENIARHLGDCALALAFISPNSIASDNCRREVTFALSKKKAFLAIMLQETKMSPGMELQLSAQQCIMKYGYDTDEAFYKKVCSSPDVERCRLHPEEQTAEVTVASGESEEKEMDGTRADGAAKGVMEAPKGKILRTQETKTKASKATKAKATDKVSGTSTRKKTPLLIGAMAVVVLVVAILFFGGGSGNIQLTEELKVPKNETYLGLREERITRDMMAQILLLEQLESLSFHECTFTDGALASLVLPATLKTLILEDCTGVDTLSCLEGNTGLSTLTLIGCEITDEMIPVMRSENLRYLTIAGNKEFTDLSKFADCVRLYQVDVHDTGVSDLSALSGQAVTRMTFDRTPVTDVTPLASWPDLSYVYGAGSKVRDISALATMEELRIIDFTGCGLQPVSARFASLYMTELHLGENELTDIEAFADCTLLRAVDLSGNPVTDVSSLAKSKESLKVLDVACTGLDSVDLSFLTECVLLEELFLDRLPLKDLNMLQNATALKKLSAIGCGLTDISGLSGCTQLYWMRLPDNEIRDISPLKNIATTNRITLDLAYNPIRDISSLPDLKYTVLSLLSEELDFKTYALTQCGELVIYYTEDILTHEYAEDDLTYYDIIGCPADKRVAMEELFSTFFVRFLDTEEELVERMANVKLDYSVLQ
ncbi:MAG: TIR domain-containing protein [Lachnospiraceae bacterium]|nr:TIR domain-containing protein [Lachnospiraceae bacterium]